MGFDGALVNKYFRNGVPFLMYGFDPWTLRSQVNGMEKSGMWTLLINNDFKEDVEKYMQNWEKVIDRYLTWQEEEYPDPVDQCHALSSKALEMHTLLFEGLDSESKKLDPSFFNLWYVSAKYLDALCEEIMGWALTHKFTDELLENVSEEE